MPATNADTPNASSFVRATSRPIRQTITSTKIANTVELPSSAMPRSSPNRCGGGASLPLNPPLNHSGTKTSASRAAAAASVTTARFTPRMRTAGRPMTTPRTTAHSAARISPNGNPSPRPAEMWATMKALSPANAFWASEICPT